MKRIVDKLVERYTNIYYPGCPNSIGFAENQIDLDPILSWRLNTPIYNIVERVAVPDWKKL